MRNTYKKENKIKVEERETKILMRVIGQVGLVVLTEKKPQYRSGFDTRWSHNDSDPLKVQTQQAGFGFRGISRLAKTAGSPPDYSKKKKRLRTYQFFNDLIF